MQDPEPIEDILGRDDLDRRREATKNHTPKKPSSWKAGLALEIEILRFIERHGIEHCALLTLLFNDRKGKTVATPAEAQNLFKRATRRLLPCFFKHYIAVLDFHRSGAVHFHLVVSTTIELREGWNFDLDAEHRMLRALSKGRPMTAEELKLCRDLTRRMIGSIRLKALMKDLRTGLADAGFPKAFPFELKPVRNPRGLARYLAGRYRESHASKLRPRHCRCRRYSRSYQRSVDPKHRFSPVGPSAALYRRKKAALGAALGMADLDQVEARFGVSWEREFREILIPVNPRDAQGFFTDQWRRLMARPEARAVRLAAAAAAALPAAAPHPTIVSTDCSAPPPAPPPGPPPGQVAA